MKNYRSSRRYSSLFRCGKDGACSHKGHSLGSRTSNVALLSSDAASCYISVRPSGISNAFFGAKLVTFPRGRFGVSGWLRVCSNFFASLAEADFAVRNYGKLN